MELIDGITLKQYMQKKGAPLNWREALHFITQIVKALSHAHGRGIIHRDIKPQNIMVLRDGSVKVADFGIARLASAAQSTLTQEALGSVHYISPEQAKGSRIDARADLYSAGVVLYEMLTGQLPYEGETPVSVAIQHISSIPLAPREINPDIPEALEAITLKAMASQVGRRYINADAMLSDLEEFRKNPNINFDYTIADLQSGNEDPTQVLKASDSYARRNASRRGRQEEEREARQGGSGLSIPVAVGAILVFLVGVGYFLWVSFFSSFFVATPEYTVPSLIGKTMAEALSDAQVKDVFHVIKGETAYSDEYAAGVIMLQDPEAGKTIKGEDLAITVTISAGREYVDMISVYNLTYRDALIKLQPWGLSCRRPIIRIPMK
jgi:serine/threonine-protein kinase